jgi:hypothetical protein
MKHTHKRGVLANDNTDFSQYRARTGDFCIFFCCLVIHLKAETEVPDDQPAGSRGVDLVCKVRSFV